MAEEPTRLEAVECLRDFGSRKFENPAHGKQYLEKIEEAITGLIPQVGGWIDRWGWEGAMLFVLVTLFFHRWWVEEEVGDGHDDDDGEC